jgi:hypothetical protein
VRQSKDPIKRYKPERRSLWRRGVPSCIGVVGMGIENVVDAGRQMAELDAGA